ncbi:MAG: hypothetical protein ACLPN1_09545 [Dissulfurispiraceae bacterium]|jgi:hypothetical protein
MLKFIMHLLPENISDLTEIVICDSESALQAHRELFRFSKRSYISSDNMDNAFPLVLSLVDTCNASASCPTRIHLAFGWENMLRVATWMTDLSSVKDTFIVLKNAGVTESVLIPFAASPAGDLFPYLYYGKRLDVLKKICIIARKQVESRVKKSPVRVDCHIITSSHHVVASSL